LDVVVQRIYQEKYGLSVADILRDDETIDGISGGCSGISTEDYNYMEEIFETGSTKKARAYNSLWIFFKGKAIRMSCLNFGSQNDLIRTCKNLYSYNTVGHLTSTNGYKLTYQYDGSRVVVVRPNLVTHWAFFVRKFDSAKQLAIDKLLSHENSDIAIKMLEWVTKGCLNAVLSGDQNSGKTTCLKAMGVFFDQRDPIRTTEPEFELWYNNTYDNLNCLCFRGSEELSLLDSINLQKKTDAARMILGEVNSFELAAAFISLCQSGSKSTLCTCHCVSTEDLVDYFRNAILASGIIGNDVMTAEEQVANSIYIDIHWEKTSDGRRYISYINEIEPFPRYIDHCIKEPMESMAESLMLLSRRRAFQVRELLTLEEGRYVIKNQFSERSQKRILKNLSAADKEKFLSFVEAS
jgi:pilus assembly protein CpaF